MSDQQGYQVPEDILRLEFTDPSFDGLVVRAYPAEWATIKAARVLRDIDDTKPLSNQAFEVVQKVIAGFASALIDWNLERRGQPVPATAEGVDSLQWPWVWQLVDAWMLSTSKLRRMQQAASRVDEVDLPMELGG